MKSYFGRMKSTPWPPVETETPAPHPDAPQAGTKLAMHYEQCFGCGEVDGGLHMRSAMGEHALVHSQFTVTEAHQGAPGLAHGGLLACAFDEALGSTVGNLLRRPAVTGKLETDFVRPVSVGSTLFITAKVDGVAGRKLYASAEGRLDAEDGPVAVRARALFVEVSFEHFTTHGDPDAMSKFQQAQDRINP
ncbi:Thioesterase superfamily protein [Amycolatopsis sacchari]|uniref:Acyl-coenzyme A thioesterase THEM4 n=2 Tax=Amycolatopsis sacchari TaxID=115433 RepID=A0A1I3U3D9_9PSEU|nr:Thioesterase superfamily protein [Amycolatopsis sacchari]